jgi:hypothetical protein
LIKFLAYAGFWNEQLVESCTCLLWLIKYIFFLLFLEQTRPSLRCYFLEIREEGGQAGPEVHGETVKQAKYVLDSPTFPFQIFLPLADFSILLFPWPWIQYSPISWGSYYKRRKKIHS